MKNIKRLTNEKAMVTKQFKEYKDGNVTLKSELDTNIQKYQVPLRCQRLCACEFVFVLVFFVLLWLCEGVWCLQLCSCGLFVFQESSLLLINQSRLFFLFFS